MIEEHGRWCPILDIKWTLTPVFAEYKSDTIAQLKRHNHPLNSPGRLCQKYSGDSVCIPTYLHLIRKMLGSVQLSHRRSVRCSMAYSLPPVSWAEIIFIQIRWNLASTYCRKFAFRIVDHVFIITATMYCIKQTNLHLPVQNVCGFVKGTIRQLVI